MGVLNDLSFVSRFWVQNWSRIPRPLFETRNNCGSESETSLARNPRQVRLEIRDRCCSKSETGFCENPRQVWFKIWHKSGLEFGAILARILDQVLHKKLMMFGLKSNTGLVGNQRRFCVETGGKMRTGLSRSLKLMNSRLLVRWNAFPTRPSANMSFCSDSKNDASLMETSLFLMLSRFRFRSESFVVWQWWAFELNFDAAGSGDRFMFWFQARVSNVILCLA